MDSKILLGLVIIGSLAAAGCEKQQEVPLPSAIQTPTPIPAAGPPGVPSTVPTVPGAATPTATAPVATVPGVPAPVATAPVVPAAQEPPQTPLIPITEEEPEKTTKVSTGTGVCKLPGPDTPGDELIPHNFMCKIETKNMPFGLTPPPFGCRVKRTGADKLVLVNQSSRSGGAGLYITETKLAGFKIDGTYTFSGQKLRINSCMRAKGVGKYQGSGNGVLNGDTKNRVKYTLTMTKQ